MTVHWHDEAETEFIEAAAHYEEPTENLGSRFEAALGTVLAMACPDPTGPRKFDGPFRKVRLMKFPYAVIYRLPNEKNLEIIAVMHLHRKPGH